MTTELKRCPFCGGNSKTEVRVTQMGGNTDNVDFSVVCTECGIYKTVRLKIAKTCLFYDVDKAMEQVVKAWNERVGGQE